jgi:hypothetical protein
MQHFHRYSAGLVICAGSKRRRLVVAFSASVVLATSHREMRRFCTWYDCGFAVYTMNAGDRIMPDDNLSWADRWMRQYEQEHPHVLQQGVGVTKVPSNGWQPHPHHPETPSQPSKTGGNACLWSAPEDPVTRTADPVVLAAIQARKSLKLTQATFARCLGISPRTVSEWEQGRRQPSGAARTLLHWAAERPEYLKQALQAYRHCKAKGLSPGGDGTSEQLKNTAQDNDTER